MAAQAMRIMAAQAIWPCSETEYEKETKNGRGALHRAII